MIPDVIPEFDETAYQVLSPQEALEQRGFFYTYTPEYRDIYHWIPKGLSEAANISYEEIDQWREETVIPNKINNVEPQEMYTVSFIKHFHIPKDIFEQVCEALPLWYDRLYDGNYDKTEEQYEIPNADIIYTFDNEIINNYYRRVQS